MLQKLKTFFKKPIVKKILLGTVIAMIVGPIWYTIATAKTSDHLTLLGQEWDQALQEFIHNGGDESTFISKEDFIAQVESGDITSW